MLEDLRITGLGVIEDVSVELGPGLTVVTGETGAGKTMVVGALRLLFGGRADTERIRDGRTQAVVEGVLSVDSDGAVAQWARDAGGEVDLDGAGASLTVRRTVTAAGRSRAQVGGAAAPVALLAQTGEQMFALHGQADQWRLTKPPAQLRAVDDYAGVDVAAIARAHREWREAQDDLDRRVNSARELEREARVLRDGVAEIEALAPQLDEDEQLAERIRRWSNAEGLRDAARAAHLAIAGDPDDPIADAPDALTLLGSARRELERADDDPALSALARRLADLGAEAEDVAHELRGYADAIDGDPASLDAAQSRLGALRDLMRRYGDDLPAVLAWSKDASDRLLALDTSDEAIAALAQRRDAARSALETLAADASQRRRGAAGALAEAITAEIRELAMPDAQLRIEVRPRSQDPADIGPDGADEASFEFVAHRGAPEVPLHRGASGGELSRVMLAIEVVLAESDAVPIMVFDEVDAGVGGRAATQIGRRLARLARDRQVIVVTHLAQVAAYAQTHLVIDKVSDQRVTRSDVRPVSGAQRHGELARMLSGQDGAVARRHAAALLREAQDDPL